MLRHQPRRSEAYLDTEIDNGCQGDTAEDDERDGDTVMSTFSSANLEHGVPNVEAMAVGGIYSFYGQSIGYVSFRSRPLTSQGF